MADDDGTEGEAAVAVDQSSSTATVAVSEEGIPQVRLVLSANTDKWMYHSFSLADPDDPDKRIVLTHDGVNVDADKADKLIAAAADAGFAVEKG